MQRTATRLARTCSLRALIPALYLFALLVLLASQASAGGKGNKGKGGGEEDIIMYNGNIVLRGDKEGGSIVMAGMHPHNEEVEFAPSFFQHAFGEMGRRR